MGARLLARIHLLLVPRPRISTITVEGIDIKFTRTSIRSMRLTIDAATGQACLTAPFGLPTRMASDFVRPRLDWVRRQQAAVWRDIRRRQYLHGDRVECLGEQYRINQIVCQGSARLVERPGFVHLYMAADTPAQKREDLIYGWYRDRLKTLASELLELWEPRLGVHAANWGIKRMKTRWGSCNTAQQRIWFNLELARLAPDCLEYVVVHELVHLLEGSHNQRFYDFLDRFLPDWADRRDRLSQEPEAGEMDY
jgi:predicted metal-dependent hydrolase